MKNKPVCGIKITDHAILRYAERVLKIQSAVFKDNMDRDKAVNFLKYQLGVDIMQIKQNLSTKTLIYKIDFFGGTGVFGIEKGFRVVVINYRILTVY